MRILFFASDNSASSGAFKMLIKVALGMREKGNEVMVLYPYHGNGNRLLDEADIQNKLVLCCPWVKHYPKSTFLDVISRPFIKLFNSTYSKRKAIKVAKKYNPDIIVINTLYTSLGKVVADHLHLPLVWHIREFINEAQNKDFIDKKKAYQMIEGSNRIICVSESLYDRFSPCFSKDKITYVYDGVDDKKFYYPNHELFKDKTTHFLLVGRVQPYKGQYILLAALNELSEYDFDVTLVGTITSSYKSLLIKKYPNISDRLIFTGEKKDTAYYYRKADIFSMNSSYEAFGLVTVEAMMSGDLVIGNKEAGTKDIISNEKYGLMYPSRDVNALKEKIEYALNNKEEMKEVALNGQKRAMDNFTERKNIEGLFSEYNKAVKVFNDKKN